LLNEYINQKMSNNDLKIGAINAITMAISFTNVESILKIILLIVSIAYTVLKTYEIIKNKKNID
jgi:hypothetical protein